MGNIIVSESTIDLISADITASYEASGYPAINTQDWWHLKRHYRSDRRTVDEYLLQINMGAAQAVTGVLLNDVNFSSVVVNGSNEDTFANPDFEQYAPVYQNKEVGRYVVYIPLLNFRYQYLQIFIPNGTTAFFGDVWQVGNLTLFSEATEFDYNMSGFGRTSSRLTPDFRRWSGDVTFGNRLKAYESNLFTLNNMVEPVLLYENMGDTSHAYLCKKTDYYGNIITDNIINGGSVKFTEIG